MAQSDESNTDPKIAVSPESLGQKHDLKTPITCHLCEQVFFDTKTLVSHFKFHPYLNGSVNPKPLAQSLAPPENEMRHNSNNSHSPSSPLNTNKTIASNPSKLPLSDSRDSPPSKKPAELIFKDQSHISSLISRSAMNRGGPGSRSYSRSRSNGKQNIISPSGPKTSNIINSKFMQGSKLLLGDSLASPPIEKTAELIFKHQPYPSPSIFRSAINYGALGSGSGSRSKGKQIFSSLSGPKTSAFINSKLMGSKLSLDDSLVSRPTKNPAELIFKHHPYPSPSIFHSAINHGVSGSRLHSNGKRNFSDLIGSKTSTIIHSKNMEGSKLPRGDSLLSPSSKKLAELIFKTQPYPLISHSAMKYGLGSLSHGKQNFTSPIWPKTSAINNSKIMEGSNFSFPMMQWGFSPPVTGDISLKSVAGTSCLGCGKPFQTTMKCDGSGHLPLSTKPYINQLERPIEGMMTGGDNDGDEVDMTLKLREF